MIRIFNLTKTLLALLLLLSLLVGCANTQETITPTQQQYVGSINSDKYHYPDCQWAGKIKPENEIWFSTKNDAEEAGYVPCKVCKP
jgi:micrococcal nuclease